MSVSSTLKLLHSCAEYRWQHRADESIDGQAVTKEGSPSGRALSAPTSDRRRIALDEAALMPIWIRQRRRAGGVEPGDLVPRQVPADCTEVLRQLLLIPGADDERRYGRPLEQ